MVIYDTFRWLILYLVTLVILNPNLKYNSVIIDRVMKNHDPDLQQPERNQKNLKRRKIMKKIIWDEIAAHPDRPHVTVVVEKVQRNRKSRGEDQKNEARNRKTRNQVEENRGQVKDRKRGGLWKGMQGES